MIEQETTMTRCLYQPGPLLLLLFVFVSIVHSDDCKHLRALMLSSMSLPFPFPFPRYALVLWCVFDSTSSSGHHQQQQQQQQQQHYQQQQSQSLQMGAAAMGLAPPTQQEQMQLAQV